MSDMPQSIPHEGEIVEPARTGAVAAQMHNPFAAARSEHVSAGAVEIQSRSAEAAVQGRMLIAKRFPRDEGSAYAKAMQSCQRLGLAEAAIYKYTKGGTVEGPSIRLAEELARLWGNIEFGLNELSRRPGESEMEAYAWDLQTNVQSSQRFTVKHLRDKSNGPATPLTAERDIYEITANNGSRRVRARILAILPPELVDDAVVACKATVKRGGGQSLGDRIRAMTGAFAAVGVTPQMLVERVGHAIDQITPDELVELRGSLTAIRDGAAVRDHFGPKQVAAAAAPLPNADGFEAAAAGAPVKAVEPAKPEPEAQAEAAPPAPDAPDPAREKAGKDLDALRADLLTISTPGGLANFLGHTTTRARLKRVEAFADVTDLWLDALRDRETILRGASAST